jgi:hypothetical protein
MDVTFQVKGNMFCSAAPTKKHMRMMEQTPTKLLLKVTNKTSDVPYCDTFAVEEEWYVASTSPTSKSAVLRIAMSVVWYKSTMMKSMILSNIKKDSAAVWEQWKTEFLTHPNAVFTAKKRKAVQSGV